MEIMSSPYKNASDSPSRQLLYELSRLGITTQENFYARLDQESHEREIQHRNALAAAAAAHDRIRRGAEMEREKLELQLQAERRRRDEEERRELERKRQQQQQAEMEAIERARLAEVARKAEVAAAEKEKREREERQAEVARQLKAQQEAQAKKEEDEKRAKREAEEARLRAEKAEQVAATASSTSRPTANGDLAASQSNGNPEREAEHRRYLAIHRNLKETRKFLISEAGKFPQVKQQMGDMRRELKKCVGQLTEGKGANRGPVSRNPGFLARDISNRSASASTNHCRSPTSHSVQRAQSRCHPVSRHRAIPSSFDRHDSPSLADLLAQYLRQGNRVAVY